MKKIAVLFLIFAAISFAAQAQPKQGLGRGQKENVKERKGTRVFVPRTGGPENMIPNLSDEQKEEIKKLHLDMAKESISLRNQIAEKRARLNTLQSEDKADINAINKTIDEIAALQAKQMKAKANFHVKVRALLNNEQKVAFDNRRPHNFNFGKEMGQMKMRSFRFDDTDFGEFEGS